MKKQILLIVAFAVSIGAMAQQKISIGVKAGLSQAGLRGDAVNSLNGLIDVTNGAITSGQRSGIFAGAFASIPVGQMFSVEPGIYYAQKGYELKGELGIKGAEFLGANANARLNSHYIDIPVVLKANINGFQLFAGPQVSYLAKADLNTRVGALGFNIVDETMDATQQMNRWDAGVTGGIGYQFTNGLLVTAAYDHGLSKVNSGQNLETYNKAFKVGVGLKF
jgi:hypothetical protein